MAPKIAGLEVFVLRASNDHRPHWVSHFMVPASQRNPGAHAYQ